MSLFLHSGRSLTSAPIAAAPPAFFQKREGRKARPPPISSRGPMPEGAAKRKRPWPCAFPVRRAARRRGRRGYARPYPPAAGVPPADGGGRGPACSRSEEHTSELQSLMRRSYDVFRLKTKKLNIPT